jgi:hypothetical protein
MCHKPGRTGRLEQDLQWSPRGTRDRPSSTYPPCPCRPDRSGGPWPADRTLSGAAAPALAGVVWCGVAGAGRSGLGRPGSGRRVLASVGTTGRRGGSAGSRPGAVPDRCGEVLPTRGRQCCCRPRSGRQEQSPGRRGTDARRSQERPVRQLPWVACRRLRQGKAGSSSPKGGQVRAAYAQPQGWGRPAIGPPPRRVRVLVTVGQETRRTPPAEAPRWCQTSPSGRRPGQSRATACRHRGRPAASARSAGRGPQRPDEHGRTTSAHRPPAGMSLCEGASVRRAGDGLRC